MLSSKKILIFTAFFLSFFFSIQIYAEPLKTVRLGYFSDDTLFMSYKPNYKSGYGYEYLQTVANLAGWKYEYEYGSFSKLLKELEEGKIDILSNVTKTDARTKNVLFPSEPMGAEESSIYVRAGDKRFTGFSPELLNGKTVALDKSDASYGKFEEFISKNKISCKIIDYSDEPSLTKAYSEPKIDAVLDSDLFAESGWEQVLKISSAEFFAAVSSSRPDILNDLNEAQKKIQIASPFYKGKLHEKFYISKNVCQGTDKSENAWLEKHYLQIKVGCLKGDSPFVFYNKESQKAEGALVDFLKMTVSKLGLSGSSLSFIFYDSPKEMADALKNYDVDIIYPVPSDYYLAEDKDYMISGTLFTIPLSVVYKGASPEKNMQRIALWDSGAIENYLKNYYPKVTPVYLKSKKDVLEAAFDKKYDSVLIDSYVAETALKTEKKFRKCKMEFIEPPLEVSLAVRKSSPGLLSILKKGMTLCDENSRRNLILLQQSARQTSSVLQSEQNTELFAALQIILLAALVSIIIYEFLMLQRYSGCEKIHLIISKKKLSGLILDEIKKNEGSELPLTLFIARIGNYKTIKKLYGSKCAKEVIFQLAKAATVERSCEIFRSGKNEVTVISRKNADEIRKEAKKGCEELEQNGITFKNRKVKIKVDFGISEYKSGIMPLQLYALADRNLFDSKNKIKPEPQF